MITKFETYLKSPVRNPEIATQGFRCEVMSVDETLGMGVSVAVLSGMTAAVCSAPFIAIVDAAITSNASGREPLWLAVKSGFRELVSKPGSFVRKPSFLWISAVYSATYVVANTTQLFCWRNHMSVDVPKFAATSATNICQFFFSFLLLDFSKLIRFCFKVCR
jgi:hypothetical protein